MIFGEWAQNKREKKTQLFGMIPKMVWLFHLSCFSNSPNIFAWVWVSKCLRVRICSWCAEIYDFRMTASHNVHIAHVCVRIFRCWLAILYGYMHRFYEFRLCFWEKKKKRNRIRYFAKFAHNKRSIVLLRLKRNGFIVVNMGWAQMKKTIVGDRQHTTPIEATIIALMTKDDDFLAKCCT